MWRIVRFLHEQGIRVWVDNEKLIPGTPVWEEEIEKAINVAPAAIVVMSPDSKNSEWVRREISLADQHRKQIFPILVRGDEDSSITLRLITRQYVDLRENENEGLHLLHTALSNYLNELKTPVAEDPVLEPIATDQDTRKGALSLEVEKESVGSDAVWGPFAWALAGALGGFMYNDYGTVVGGVISGAIGGVITAITSRSRSMPLNQKNLLWISVAWAIAGAVGWTIGYELTEAIGMGIGFAILAAIAFAITLRIQQIPINWMSMAWIISAWAIGGIIGWSIGKYIQDNEILDSATGWALGHAVGWAISGYVTVWQMRKMKL